jgi:hypothetical protein
MVPAARDREVLPIMSVLAIRIRASPWVFMGIVLSEGGCWVPQWSSGLTIFKDWRPQMAPL